MTAAALATAPGASPAARLYQPGLHILATFAAAPAPLQDAAASRHFFAALVHRLGLQCVGEAWHVFDDSQGFTAVLSLTESHLSIHTWPEHGLATFDVFLSNFRQDNHATVRAAYGETLAFFGGREQSYAEVLR